MKCQICKKKTTIDTSVGYDEFIVCNKCFYRLCDKNIKHSHEKVMSFIFKCGMIRRENND